MRIEGIDVYWVKLPLAFVCRTSYRDQYYTDTILVRMAGEGYQVGSAAERSKPSCGPTSSGTNLLPDRP